MLGNTCIYMKTEYSKQNESKHHLRWERIELY